MTEREKRAAERQGGGYVPPVTKPPKGGPVPAWRDPAEPPPR